MGNLVLKIGHSIMARYIYNLASNLLNYMVNVAIANTININLHSLDDGSVIMLHSSSYSMSSLLIGSCDVRTNQRHWFKPLAARTWRRQHD